MGDDLSYKYRKEEIKKHRSCYFKDNLFGMPEKRAIPIHKYGAIKNESKKRGAKR